METEQQPTAGAKPVVSMEVVHQIKTAFSQIGEELKCSICLGLFDRPITLDCSHSFCTPCLQEMENRVSSESIECPLCRKCHRLTSKGVSDLRVNTLLLNIVGTLKSVGKTCDECKQNPVAEHCKECSVDLCDKCGIVIHSLRLFQHHSRHPVNPEDCLVGESRGQVLGENHIQPDDVVVNFVIRRAACLTKFHEWRNSLWFAPSDLSANGIRQFDACFLPYWLFEVETSSKYSAKGTLNVDMKQSDTFWDTFTDITIGRYRCEIFASDCLEPDLLKKLEPWHLSSISENQTGVDVDNSSGEQSVLKGGPMRVQTYPAVVDQERAWLLGTQAGSVEENEKSFVENKIKAMARADCEKLMKQVVGPFGAYRDMRVETVSTRVAAQRVFLPVYIIRYMYKENPYIVLVNGQTGQLHGQRPYFWNKLYRK